MNSSASLLLLFLLQVSQQIQAKESSLNLRPVRQLGLGNILSRPISGQNQGGRRGPSCEGPQRQRGKCLPMDQCVLRELNEDYVKNMGFLCPLRPDGPVGVCCPDSIANPIIYQEGMFGKNTASGKTGEEPDDEELPQTTPEDVELL